MEWKRGFPVRSNVLACYLLIRRATCSCVDRFSGGCQGDFAGRNFLLTRVFYVRNSEVGDLLVATTEVDGSILNRGVCLLVYEDEDSAVGVMLNRPMQVFPAPSSKISSQPQIGAETTSSRLSQFVEAGQPEVSDQPAAGEHHDADEASDMQSPLPDHAMAFVGMTDDPDAGKLLVGKSLYFGGPLSGPVVAVHGAAHLAEAEAGDGIFVAAQRDHLEALMQPEQLSPYRLIIGHLGWTQEQLSGEIEAGVWHRIRATNDILSTADEWLWPKLIRSATAGSVSRWLGASHVADAHILN